MAHFACICLPYLGHINPMAALARELVRRGHKVTFLHMPDVAPALRGFDFVAVGATTHPRGWLAQATRRLGAVRGYLGLAPILHDFAGVTSMLCETLPSALKALSVDIILTDQLEAAGGMVAYHMGLPFVSLAAALPLNWEPGIPSPFVGWAYGSSHWHRGRNIVSAFAARKMRRPLDDAIAIFADRWRLPQGRRTEDYMSGFAQISQLVPSFDYPRSSLIGCFHYCGPLRDRQESTPARPGAKTPGAKIRRAFASLGSLQGHRAALFEKIAEAASTCGFELTIAHGGRLSDAESLRLSRRADVHAFVDQRQVLAECDVAILHGGLNTVLDALAYGVPIVAIPLAFEQGAIAARIAHAGLGRVCGWPLLGPTQLARCIRRVGGDRSISAAAAQLRTEITAAGGVTRAADIVEHVVTTGHPCHSPRVAPDLRLRPTRRGSLGATIPA